MSTSLKQPDFHALMEKFNAEHLMFPAYVGAFNEVSALLDLYRCSRINQNLLIVGEAGTGKTTICKAIVNKNPRLVQPERDLIPVLHISIPATATISGVCEEILNKLGDPYASTGTVSIKTTRIIKLMSALSVELLLIDEGQHIQDRGRSTTQYMVGDWIKSLMDQIRIPTVILGLPRVINLLQTNEQLRRRFTRLRRLEMGQDSSMSIENECLALFLGLAESLPFKFKQGQAGWSEYARRIYFACDGRVAYIKKLLAGTIRIATDNSITTIEPQTLEAAFTAEVWWEGIGPLNPFNDKFIFRTLNQANEPFEKIQATRRRTP